MTKNLLVELFVEELPPKALKKLGETFGSELFRALGQQDFLEPEATLTTYASPRRLAAHITQVRAVSREKMLRSKLMPVKIGFDANGEPTPALVKKLMSLGYHAEADFSAIVKERVTTEMDGKNEVLVHTNMASGSPLRVGLESAAEQACENLPIPKLMSYQLEDGWSTVNFVRPAHGLVALHGAEVVPIELLGLKAGRSTRGHRFEAAADPIELRDADSYEVQLEKEGAVIPSFDKRRAEIARQLQAAAVQAGGAPIADDALLDEVTALVERPNVLLGRFEEAFLQVPQECLILTMKANQKYFPLLDGDGRLTNQFLIVANISPTDPSAVVAGNERVVRPRLADAKFFYDQDRKKSLADRIPGLAKVVYHNKLGSQGERAQRVAAIAGLIGHELGGEALARLADQAALLAKADLLTDMVGEFPELQGVMGRYYALHDGLPAEIADAVEDHYKPRFSGDSLPRNDVGVAVALADKLETLVGLFGIGQVPTGDKDPFALRRHALGVIRMLVEKDLPLELATLLKNALGNWLDAARSQKVDALAGVEEGLAAFIWERLAGSLREQGYTAQEVDAVVALRPQRLGEIPKRLAAVRAFAELPEAESLAAANKRVGNILKKVEGGVTAKVDHDLFKEPAEQDLAKALVAVKAEADAAFERGDYTASLQALAALKGPVDAFFDQVMVNVEDLALRANRLGLLAQLHAAMNRVADLSRLAS